MKYELLKRTAIALFVGGVTSSYTVAADDSLDTATTNFTKAIKEEVKKQTDTLKAEQDKKVEEISSDLTGVATDLVGVTANSYNNTLTLNGFKAGDDLYDIDPETGKVTKKPATEEDVKNDPLEGKGVVATVIKNKDSLDDLSEDLGDLENKVNGIVETAANKDDLGKLNDAVVKLQEDTNEHTDILNNNSEDIAANKEAIDINKQDIETLKKSDQYRDLIKVKDLVENKADKEALVSVNADVEKNTQSIKVNKASIDAKAGKIYVDKELAKKANSVDVTAQLKQKADQSTLDAYNNSLVTAIGKKADKQALEDLKKEVKDNKEGIGELSETVSKIDDNVVGLTDAHNKLLKEHNNLVEDVKGFNDAYNKFTDATNTELDKKADIDDVEDALSRKANASDVYTKNESDSKLDVKADKTELAIKADKTELANKADKNSVYSKSETDNKFALKADNSVVSAQAADINNLRTDVNAHKVDINKLRTDVNTHTKRLDHLDNRVNKLDKDLKRGLAAQAALTGLFQPYTVGKANFTAAVGGYKSQTAVAIGTGYRYNQNIATKAGVAFTQGGGVTYNAGVNFEW